MTDYGDFETCSVCGGPVDMGMCECAYQLPRASASEGSAWLAAGITAEDMIAARQTLDAWGQEDAAQLAIQSTLSILAEQRR